MIEIKDLDLTESYRETCNWQNSAFVPICDTAYEQGYEQGVNDAVSIQSILINEEAKVVTIKFLDGDVRVIRCHQEDEFDYNVGVSLAISEHIFGSKNQRNKIIKEVAKVIKKSKVTQSNKKIK